MTGEKIREIVAQMTLAEKAGMLSGADFWHTKGVERLFVPQTMLSDGPHGLRKQDQEGDHLGVNDSIKAVCFPAGCAAASSFNRELIWEQGRHLGTECQAEGVAVLLGPAMNIKRSPLCGRNFEYLSEDPYLTGEMASALVTGVQSRNVGTSPKHFAMNNQETRRMSVSVEADERTMREIYLAGFETLVKKTKPWTLMCSYNRINDTYSAANRWLLKDVLRTEWGFDGYVMSDWGAVDERISDLVAGLNLEMPGNGGVNDRRIIKAVQDGILEEAVLDESVAELLNIVFRFEENRDTSAVFDYEGDHELARRVAEESMVLLKNEGALPLKETETAAFIGKYAVSPRYQGGGSSHVNSCKVTSAMDALKDPESGQNRYRVVFAQGFDDKEDVIDEALEAEALEAAASADKAVIFAGLPDSFESEGYDRTHMRLPDSQLHLIEAVAKVQPNTIVLLHNGSPVEMPWITRVNAVLECYLGGQAVGAAQVNLLYGVVNPSGKLAETFPVKLSDNPSYLNFPGEGDVVEYREGIFVGYRYYDKKQMEVLFPFGHGLSYTEFSYRNLTVDRETMKDTETLTVSVDVTNTGACAGKEVVQLYVSDSESSVIRPEKELKGFEKVELKPGETKTVLFTLGQRAFAYWNTKLSGWYVETGDFMILIGRSSRDIVLGQRVTVESTVSVPHAYTVNSTMGDLMSDPELSEYLSELQDQLGGAFTGGDTALEEAGGPANEAITPEMLAAMMKDTPLRSVLSFGGGRISHEELDAIVAEINRRKGVL